LNAAEAALDSFSADLGAALHVDGPTLLRERSEILGIAPGGTQSAGGTCRLFPARDRWVAINLARRDDLDLLPAWMGHESDAPAWDAVAAHLQSADAHAAVERAQLLGLPAAVADKPTRLRGAAEVRGGARRSPNGTPRVVDLSTLWAGPLCGRLLGRLGAIVVKVELPGRPDGARIGPAAFWNRMNAEKAQRVVELTTLRDLVATADVVVTSARRRAIEHLDLGLETLVRERGLIWVAITGYGYDGPRADWVAFGDDAAVAGGLAAFAGGVDAPEFVGDAPADPLAGLVGARVATRLLESGRGGLVDVSMRECVAAALGEDPRYPSVQEVA
jgi:hypothetical protein